MINKIGLVICFTLLLFIGVVNVDAQVYRNQAYRAYIRDHASEAVKQMNKYSVPASITMAQALIESGAGNSILSRDFNNHFGIKCHSSWPGRRTYKNDDNVNDCFRAYDHWQDSYEDHSIFLKRNRYRKLFDLDITDYIGWARGLQDCGYATNKGYANMLILVIESGELYLLDEGIIPSWVSEDNREQYLNAENKKTHIKSEVRGYRQTYISYGLLYVLAKKGDSFLAIARDFDMEQSDLAMYNDVPENFPIHQGDIVYLQMKNTRATYKYPIYTVKVGDSMHSISQLFGIRLSSLYELNGKDLNFAPQEGDVLRLR